MSVFKKGIAAFKSGNLGNPHPVNTDQNRQWEAGFNSAYFNNLEKVKRREQRFDKEEDIRGRSG